MSQVADEGIMTIQVHGPVGLTSTGRVLITLFEKEVEHFEVVNVDMMNLEHKTPEYLKSQPFGQIPFIVDGDLTLYETRAIARYIEHKFGDQGTPLYGQTPEDHALTEQWLEVESHHYMGPVHDVVYNVCFAHLWGKKCDDVVVAAGMAKLEAVLDVYEDRLSATEYLAGSFFGLADMSHIPFTYFMIHLAHKGHIFFCRPHVNAWVAKIHSRSSTLKWLNMAGLAK